MDAKARLTTITKISDSGVSYPQQPQQSGGSQQTTQPSEFKTGPVHQDGLEAAVKILYQHTRPVQVRDNRNEYEQLQYRVQQLKSPRCIRGRPGTDAFPDLQCQNPLFK